MLLVACLCALSLWQQLLSFVAPSLHAGHRVPRARSRLCGATGAAGSFEVFRQTKDAAAAVGATIGSPRLGDVDTDVPSISWLLFSGLTILTAIGSGLAASSGAKVAIQGVVGLVALYVIMSVNEYLVHRYYQHVGFNKTGLFRWLRNTFPKFPQLKSSGHVEHHKETRDDMTLDIRPHPILDADRFRGTAFSWSVSAVMTIEIALQSYPVLWLLGWSWKWSTIALFGALGLHAAVWQSLHPAMHELPDVPIRYGIPGWLLAGFRNTHYFHFLRMNHEGHHRVRGAHGNYNVCLPLADHLFGTYVGLIPAKEPVIA